MLFYPKMLTSVYSLHYTNIVYISRDRSITHSLLRRVSTKYWISQLECFFIYSLVNIVDSYFCVD